MAETASKKVETMVIEWINQRDSGYRRDDMKGSPLEGKISCGSQCFVPNTGKRAEEILDGDGKPTGRYKHVAIRYIKGCEEIDVQEQKKRGIEPSAIKTEDSIMLEKGNGLIKNEGDVGFYQYMANVFYNADAPNRPKSAPALFKVVKKDNKIAEMDEAEFARSKAVGFVSTLVTKVSGEYKYNEAKIDNALSVLGKFGGDSYAEKISVLTNEAKLRPIPFLQNVTKLEEQTTTEISHALQLNVFRFNENTAEYVEDKEVIAQLGEGRFKQEVKIKKLGDLLQTPEYQSQYEKFKIKLEIAQENSLK